MNRQIRVLIVEDNVIIALDLKLILESFGYKVVGIASSYKKAINFLFKIEYSRSWTFLETDVFRFGTAILFKFYISTYNIF